MSTRIPKPIIFLLSFILLVGLYWPSMNGTPIWDDFQFWFQDPVMKPHMSYFEIWRKFAWPLSVSTQKFMLMIFGHKFFYYHFFNLLIHFANSLLVYKLGRLLRFKYPMIFFLLFLLHPICVITTAWMIQIKTLMCFFFGLASILTFLKGQKEFKWMVVSWVLFALSLLSKSASLTLPLIMLVICLKTHRYSKLHLLIPFFLLSGFNAYKVLTSPVTLEGTEKASNVTKLKEKEPEIKPVKVVKTEPEPQPKPEVKPEPQPKPEPKPETKPDVVKAPEEKIPAPITVPLQETPETPKSSVVVNDTPGNVELKKSLKFIGMDWSLISQTMYYYFWQTIVPVRTEPVKGLNYSKAGLTEIFHILFLIIMIFVFWKDSGLIYLGAAHFLLIPFLGFIPAPFMNITWVSDQHLYLVLPAFLCFWMRIVDKIKWKYAYVIPAFFLVFFSWKTFESSKFYKNQFVFYEKSIEYNPYNVPMIYNLAFARITNDEWNVAYILLESTMDLASDEPLMRQNIYFPHLAVLHYQMKMAIEKNEN